MESLFAPISRFLFDAEAMLALAQRIIEERDGVPRHNAELFLGLLSEEVYILMGLLADAGDECLSVLRRFDTEEAQSGLTSADIQEFLDRIAHLFIEERVRDTDGHTKMILRLLEHPHMFFLKGVGRCVGGAGSVTADMKSKAIQHMKNWVLLVRQGLPAEFPTRETMQSMSIFETVLLEELKRKSVGEPIARLSGAFGFCAHEFTSQFCSVWPYSRQTFLRSGKSLSAKEAWRQTLTRMQKQRCAVQGPLVLFVLCRAIAWSISTSGLEQRFSKAALWVNERQLVRPACFVIDLSR